MDPHFKFLVNVSEFAKINKQTDGQTDGQPFKPIEYFYYSVNEFITFIIPGEHDVDCLLKNVLIMDNLVFVK